MRQALYLLRFFLGATFLGTLGLSTLLLVVELADHVGALTAHAGLVDTLRWLGTMAVLNLYQVLPLAGFFAGLVTTTILGRRGELLAIALSGVGPRVTRFSLAAGGTLIAIIVFAWGQHVAPAAASAMSSMRQSVLGRSPTKMSQRLTRPNAWFRIKNKLLHLPEAMVSNSFLRPTLYQLNNDLVTEVIEAERLEHADGEWFLRKARVHSSDVNVAPTSHETLRVPLGVEPEHLSDVVADPQQLSFGALASLVTRRQAAGLDTTVHEVLLHGRFADPLLALLLVVLAGAWGLRPQRERFLSVDLAVGAVTLAVLLALGQSARLLAMSHQVPVVVGAWTMDVAVLLLVPVTLWVRRP